jgi:hypothetical protein
MKKYIPYNRKVALNYAHKWAYSRNPAYSNFDGMGGDCTNFASQVIFSGCKIMNFTPVFGWYYLGINNRSPSWSGVEYLYKFLVNNKNSGPFGKNSDINEMVPCDIIQLSFNLSGDFNHSLVVVETGANPNINNILVATHTFDRDFQPLYKYSWQRIRFIHIIGVRIITLS